MKRQSILLIVFIILILPFVFSSGSIQTGSVTPGLVDLCGSYQQYVTITAANIQNWENTTLNSVSARLYLSGSTGLNYVTSQEVNLGNINALSASPSSPTWTLQCNSPVSGTYRAYINYTSANGYKGSSYDEAYTIINVHDAITFYANISIIEEQITQQDDYTLISDSTPTIKAITTRNSICKGSLDIDKSYQDMDFVFYGSLRDHNYTFIDPLSEGFHTTYVRCKDESDNYMASSVLIKFLIDTQSSQIQLLSPPQRVVGEFTELSVKVNEDSECRYDSHDDSFYDMRLFDLRENNTFSGQITDLEEGEYTYFIRCKDNGGNIASLIVPFNVLIPPKAEITLDKDPPLSKGTYEIMLEPSKKLRSIPALSYSFTDDATFTRQINLIKEDDYYKGYIIIDDNEKTRSGVFSFHGYDLDGTEGDEITKGAIFLVDTIKPIAPESFQATAAEQGVTLKWYYDGEKMDHFNVYRSAAAGVGHIHFYAATSKAEYIDKNVVNNQVYYYRIAAVDTAGNIGELSNEVSVYAKSEISASGPLVINQNPPTEETRNWKIQASKNIDTLLIDLEWAIKNLKDQETKDAIVGSMSLVKQAEDAKTEIDKLKTQIKNIDLASVADTDLREALSKADAAMARTRKNTPQSLEVVKSTNTIQATAETDVETAVTELINSLPIANFSDSQIKDYKQKMGKINSNVKVESEIKTLSLEYLDIHKETRISVAKKISYESPDKLANVISVEIIPKTVAGDISSIDIKTPEYNVIKSDPVIAWTFDSLSYDKQAIFYILLANDNSESAKTAKNIILLDPQLYMTNGKNIMTGFSIFLSKIKTNGVQVLGVLLGVIILLGLSMYYLVVINEVNLGDYLKKIPFAKNIGAGVLQKPIERNIPQHTPQKISDNPVSGSIVSIRQDKDNFSYFFRKDNPIKTIPGQYFYVKNGDVIRCLSELPDVLLKMDDFTFYYHVTDSRNDIAEWVETIYHNYDLAELIRSSKTRHELIQLLKELLA